ncbi:MAG: hypothetical protein ACR2QF_06155 [Geminicoccaceae bacterium]
MATFYVDSNAAGANDGTSFADAFLSVDDLPVLAVVDVVLVASDHVDNITGQLLLGVANTDIDYVTFISVNSLTEVYEAGASLSSTSNISLQTIELIGFTLTASTDLDAVDGSRGLRLRDCTFSCSVADLPTFFEFIDCAMTFTNGSRCIQNIASSGRIIGGSAANSAVGAGDDFIRLTIGAGYLEVIGVDLSAMGAQRLISDRGGRIRGFAINFFGCRFNASTTIFHISDQTNDHANRLEIKNCFSGTTAVAALGYDYIEATGECSLDASVTRTGGASDGETSYTLALTAFANETARSIRSAKPSISGISQWVEPGDTNLRIYIAHDGVGSGAAGALQDNECWAEYQGPSESATADATLEYKDTRAEFGETAADLTLDGSVWSGAGVGTEQRIDIAIDPTEAGYAHVWLNFAPESGSDQTIHFDPKIEVT